MQVGGDRICGGESGGTVQTNEISEEFEVRRCSIYVFSFLMFQVTL
jgi:hypothetical protein